MKKILSVMVICILSLLVGFGIGYMLNVSKNDVSASEEEEEKEQKRADVTDQAAGYEIPEKSDDVVENDLGTWEITSVGKKYYDGAGIPVVNLSRTFGDVTFYFDENGIVRTDCWYTEGENTYWLDSYGIKWTGWRNLDGGWHYFDESGNLMKNTTTPDGYTVNEEGVLYYQE
jgi:hypothetical protein